MAAKNVITFFKNIENMEDDIRLRGKPSIDEFCHYIEAHGFDLDPYELYKDFDNRGWTNKKGELAKSWHALVSARNSIVCRNGREKKPAKKTRKIHTLNSGYVKSRPHSVRSFRAYVKAIGNWDGSAMGCAYIISEGGETYEEGIHGFVGVRSYEAEFRGIIAAAKMVPDDSSVFISTNNQLLESLNYLKKPQRGDKFYSLKKSLWEQKQRLTDVKVVYNKKVFNDKWLNSAADMAEQAFEHVCEEKGIPNKQMSYA